MKNIQPQRAACLSQKLPIFLARRLVPPSGSVGLGVATVAPEREGSDGRLAVRVVGTSAGTLMKNPGQETI